MGTGMSSANSLTALIAMALVVVAVAGLADRRWLARALVTISGLVLRNRRYEFAAELHYLQTMHEETGLRYALGTLPGASSERISTTFLGLGRSIRSISPRGLDPQPLLLSVPGGSIVGLIGWSNSGRSSIARVTAQTLASGDTGGTVSIASDSGQRGNVLRIGEGLINSLTVAENLVLHPGFSLSRWIVSPQQQRRQAVHALDRVRATHISPDTPVRNLSRCDRALVEIAAAAGSGKPIVVQDNPAFSDQTRQTVGLALQHLRARGISVVLVTHNVNDICRLADRVAVMHEGRLTLEMDTAHVSPQDVIHELVVEN